jgi:branched-subunit amino acid aminotransferase/4-amino-4-deoxychorismate lyase
MPPGNLTEGPASIVFVVQDGVVRTPDRGVLEGVSRRTAIELCAQLGIPLRIEPVPAKDLERCDEVFLTSSGGGILPIAKVDGRALPKFPGPGLDAPAGRVLGAARRAAPPRPGRLPQLNGQGALRNTVSTPV